MIGKPEWFERRKYAGWGLHPKGLKGWLYVLGFILPLLIFHLIPYWNTKTRLIVTGTWALILIIDTINIMAKMKKDERETLHEAKAERNAVWTITIILSIGLAYQIAMSALKQELLIDWWIAAALIAGLIIKSCTNYYLSKKN